MFASALLWLAGQLGTRRVHVVPLPGHPLIKIRADDAALT